MPCGRERARFRLPVTHDHRDDQVRIVERSSVSVRYGIAEFAAFMNRAWRFGRAVAADPAGEGELLEQTAEAFLILGDVAVYLGVGSLEIHIRNDRRRPVSRPRQKHNLKVIQFYQA